MSFIVVHSTATICNGSKHCRRDIGQNLESTYYAAMTLPFQASLAQGACSCFYPGRLILIRRIYMATGSRRLASTLVVLERRNGKLKSNSLASICAAQKLDGPVHGFLTGRGARDAAAEAAKISGLEKVVYVDNEAYDKGLSENCAPLLVANMKNVAYTHIISSHSSFSGSLLPRVAALLDVQPVSNVTNIQSQDTFVRPIYAGNAVLTL